MHGHARCYCPQLLETSEVELDGPEAHHLLHVLRAEPGQRVSLFDGQGGEALADIASLTRRSVVLRIAEHWTVASSAGAHIVLATAVPKGERFRWLVEKATELGVDRLVPLETARSVALPRASKLANMEQVVVAACKQSGRSRLMRIDEPSPWDRFVAEQFPGNAAYVAHPTGIVAASAIKVAENQPIVLAIGPEGCFTDEEIAQAVEAGASLIGLGSHVLRIETAAITLAAIAMTSRLSTPAPSGRGPR